jgi:hypothetical protein
MTWARQHAPDGQQPIADAYTSVGAELGAIVVPVGLVWQKFLSKHESPALHDRDGSHPTLAGSYLAACVFLASLLELNPVGIESGPPGLLSQETTVLQNAAWKQLSRPTTGGGNKRGGAPRPVDRLPTYCQRSWPT